MGAATIAWQRGGRRASALAATPAGAAGTLSIGGDLVVNRMGFGAMRITGSGIWGEPKDPREARSVLRRVWPPDHPVSTIQARTFRLLST